MLYYIIWGLTILSWIALGIAMEKERSRYRKFRMGMWYATR